MTEPLAQATAYSWGGEEAEGETRESVGEPVNAMLDDLESDLSGVARFVRYADHGRI